MEIKYRIEEERLLLEFFETDAQGTYETGAVAVPLQELADALRPHIPGLRRATKDPCGDGNTYILG